MPLPISPVVPGLEAYEINFGVNQPEYLPLPALRSSQQTGYKVISRWQPTADERKQIAEGADIYLTQLTFGHPYQPSTIVIVQAESFNLPNAVSEILRDFGLDDELNERLRSL